MHSTTVHACYPQSMTPLPTPFIHSLQARDHTHTHANEFICLVSRCCVAGAFLCLTAFDYICCCCVGGFLCRVIISRPVHATKLSGLNSTRVTLYVSKTPHLYNMLLWPVDPSIYGSISIQVGSNSFHHSIIPTCFQYHL